MLLTGDRVREARRWRKMTQTDLARRVGTSASQISMMETHKSGTSLKTAMGSMERSATGCRWGAAIAMKATTTVNVAIPVPTIATMTALLSFIEVPHDTTNRHLLRSDDSSQRGPSPSGFPPAAGVDLEGYQNFSV